MCVQEISRLDEAFCEDNADAIRDAAEYPHAVMMLFAGHLARRFSETDRREQMITMQDQLIRNTLAIIEKYLGKKNVEVKTLIVDSFIEQIYDENVWLFDYLMNMAGPLVHQEMLIHKLQRQSGTQ